MFRMHRLAGFAVLLLAAGCLREKVQYCNNGAYCPEPLLCTENATAPFCGEPGDVDQCFGKADETPCVYRMEKNGYCLVNLCTKCDPNFSFCRYDVWTVMPTVVAAELKGVWAAGPTDVYVVGKTGAAIRWNGREWKTFLGIRGDAEHESIWGVAADNIYAVSVGLIDGTRVYRFDGSTWLPQLPGSANVINAVGGASANRVFTVGFGGEIGVYDGTWMYSTPASPTVMNGVWATDENNAVAVGAPGPMGNVIRYARPTWAFDMTGTSHILNDVAGAGSTEFAVGRRSTTKVPAVMQRQNTMWMDMTGGLPSVGAVELRGVWVVSPTEVYAVGEGGTILRYDGVTWTSMPTNVTAALNEVFATTTDVLAVGANGTVLRLSR